MLHPAYHLSKFSCGRAGFFLDIICLVHCGYVRRLNMISSCFHFVRTNLLPSAVTLKLPSPLILFARSPAGFHYVHHRRQRCRLHAIAIALPWTPVLSDSPYAAFFSALLSSSLFYSLPLCCAAFFLAILYSSVIYCLLVCFTVFLSVLLYRAYYSVIYSLRLCSTVFFSVLLSSSPYRLLIGLTAIFFASVLLYFTVMLSCL